MPNIGNNGKIGNDLFSSVAAGPREETPKVKNEIDDFLYELPDTGLPHFELGDKLANDLEMKVKIFLMLMLLQQKKKRKMKF